MSSEVLLQQFIACESACIPLLRPGCSRDDLQECAARIDQLLWVLFPTDPATSAFWTDGIEAQSVTRDDEGLAMFGMLCCAQHRDQWHVSIRAELAVSQAQSARLERVHIFIGDGAYGALRQPSARHFRQPEHWFCEFRVPRPQPCVVAPGPILSAVRAWLSANPTGRVVDCEWQPLTLEAAEALIRDRAAAGVAVATTATWLDGADALQLDQPKK